MSCRQAARPCFERLLSASRTNWRRWLRSRRKPRWLLHWRSCLVFLQNFSRCGPRFSVSTAWWSKQWTPPWRNAPGSIMGPAVLCLVSSQPDTDAPFEERMLGVSSDWFDDQVFILRGHPLEIEICGLPQYVSDLRCIPEFFRAHWLLLYTCWSHVIRHRLKKKKLENGISRVEYQKQNFWMIGTQRTKKRVVQPEPISKIWDTVRQEICWRSFREWEAGCDLPHKSWQLVFEIKCRGHRQLLIHGTAKKNFRKRWQSKAGRHSTHYASAPLPPPGVGFSQPFTPTARVGELMIADHEDLQEWEAADICVKKISKAKKHS